MPPKKKKDIGSVYAKLAGLSKRARLMSEVEDFRVVPTPLRGFNRATRVGGAPLSCVWVVHGPSGGGKTALLCAVIRGFQAVGGICVFVDAELAASTRGWFRALGVDLRRCLYIGRTDPDAKDRPKPLSFEEIVEEIDTQVSGFKEAKRAGEIAPGTPLLLIVDSLSKMVPASLLKAIDADEGGDGIKKGIGRLQAAMNTAWLLGLGPRVGDDDIVFAAIAHEYEAAGNGAFAQEVKVRGGNAMIYDAMVQVRVTFAGQVKDLAAEGAPAVGKRHRLKILKNKHGPAFGEGYFYTSTGDGIAPLGFDRPRELVHEAMERGLVPRPKEIKLTKGSDFVFEGRRYTIGDLYDEGAEPVLLELEARLDAGVFETPLTAPERPTRRVKGEE